MQCCWSWTLALSCQNNGESKTGYEITASLAVGDYLKPIGAYKLIDLDKVVLQTRGGIEVTDTVAVKEFVRSVGRQCPSLLWATIINETTKPNLIVTILHSQHTNIVIVRCQPFSPIWCQRQNQISALFLALESPASSSANQDECHAFSPGRWFDLPHRKINVLSDLSSTNLLSQGRMIAQSPQQQDIQIDCTYTPLHQQR